MESMVETKGDKAQYEIEKMGMDAFAAYKKENETFAKKSTISQ